MLNQNRWKQCEHCSRRNCRKVPPQNKKCFKFIKMQEGFKFWEIVSEKDPVTLSILCHRAKLKPRVVRGRLRLEKIK